jgi:hypothetical protein
VIAFGSPITKPDVYDLCAAPGLRLSAEPGSEVIAMPAQGSIFRSYNALLDRAAELDDLEAMVIVHQDTEIVDPDFCAKARRALEDPDVGVAGCVGAVGVRSIAWWEGSVALASFIHRYPEHGGGDLPAFAWEWADAPPYARTGEVDTVDGFLLVIAPWVVRNIRFDESLGRFHGYDFDFCLQVREAGRKVVTTDLRAIHHHSLDLVSDPEEWIQAHMRVAEKWDGRMPEVGWYAGTWEERARLAEAETDFHRAKGYTAQQELAARVQQAERELVVMKTSISWRITAPLRLLSWLTAPFRRLGRPAGGTR